MNSQLQKHFLKPYQSLKEALEVINLGDIQIALIVDENLSLLGTVTDGDIRRGLLHELSLNDEVRKVMNVDYSYGREACSKQYCNELCKDRRLKYLPILDDSKRVVQLFKYDQQYIESSKIIESPVVIMAGGKGLRLRPLTESCPKPMLKLGNSPILEVILNQFISQGFSNFFLSVNYLKDQIIDYFNDGSSLGVSINYLSETKPLGTAGSLSLLPAILPAQPILIVNGDILSKVDFSEILQYHKQNQAIATLCVRNHAASLPFGVVTTEGAQLLSIKEKPTLNFLVNSGIYVIEPCLLSLISQDEAIDMPTLLERALSNGSKIVTYPIYEYWLDIGRPETLLKASAEWTS